MTDAAACASRTLLLAAPLFLAGLALGCGQAPAAPGEEEGPPAPVKAVHGEREPLAEWTTLPGTTQPLPNHVARVTAAVEGRVLTVLPPDETGKGAAEGDLVPAGRVVVRLDDQIPRANRAKAEAALTSLNAQKQQAITAEKLARLDLDNWERLQQTRRSSASGLSQELVAPINVDKARLALEDAEAKLRAAEAMVASGQVELDVIDTQLRFYTLRAPIAGRLSTIQVVPGQTLSVGTTVAEVVDLNEIDALCYAPPSSVFRLALGQPARMVLPGSHAEGDASVPQGKVIFIAVQAQAESGSIPVKVRFPNRGLRFRANTIVQVQIQTAPEQQRLTIPEAALLEDQEPPKVFIVEDLKTEEKEGKKEQAGKARLLQAVVGIRSPEQHKVEIVGLEDPEKKKPVPPLKEALFVIEGAHGLQDGDPVRLEEEEEHDEQHKGEKSSVRGS